MYMLRSRFCLCEIQGCDAAQTERRATRERTRESCTVLAGTFQSRAQANQKGGGQVSQCVSGCFSASIVELQSPLEYVGYITGTRFIVYSTYISLDFFFIYKCIIADFIILITT